MKIHYRRVDRTATMTSFELSSPQRLGRTVVIGYCDIGAAGIRKWINLTTGFSSEIEARRYYRCSTTISMSDYFMEVVAATSSGGTSTHLSIHGSWVHSSAALWQNANYSLLALCSPRECIDSTTISLKSLYTCTSNFFKNKYSICKTQTKPPTVHPQKS